MATTTLKRGATSSVKAGIVAGLGGGVVFGMLMAMMGMLPMVAGLVKSDNPVVGFGVHMAISAFIGAVYGSVAPRLPGGGAAAVIGGTVYGAIWWVLGALIAMPVSDGRRGNPVLWSRRHFDEVGGIAGGPANGVALASLEYPDSPAQLTALMR